MRIPPTHPRRFVFSPLFCIGNTFPRTSTNATTIGRRSLRFEQRSRRERSPRKVIRASSFRSIDETIERERESFGGKNRGRRKKQGEDGKKELERGKEARSRAGFVATPKPGCGWCWCWCCCSLLGETSRKLYTHTLPVCPLTRIRIPIQIFAHTPPETPTLRTDTVASSHMLTVKGGNERSSRTYAHAHLHASWKMSITKNHCSFALSSCPSLFLAIFLVRLLARQLARSLAPRFVRSMVRARTIASTHFHCSSNTLSLHFVSLFRARSNQLPEKLSRCSRRTNRRSPSMRRATLGVVVLRLRCVDALPNPLPLPKILRAAYYQTRFTPDFLANTTPRWVARFFLTDVSGGEENERTRNAYRRALLAKFHVATKQRIRFDGISRLETSFLTAFVNVARRVGKKTRRWYASANRS